MNAGDWLMLISMVLVIVWVILGVARDADRQEEEEWRAWEEAEDAETWQ